jgi:hypothetical protein
LFPQNGPTTGLTPPTRITSSTFNLPTTGTYEVHVQASFSPAGQLALAIGGVKLPNTQIGRATSTTQGVIATLITTGSPNQVLSVINPGSHGTPLIITPNAGGDAPEGSVSATLVIKFIG